MGECCCMSEKQLTLYKLRPGLMIYKKKGIGVYYYWNNPKGVQKYGSRMHIGTSMYAT